MPFADDPLEFGSASARTQNPPAIAPRRPMWPWIAAAFGLGLAVGSVTILAARVNGDAIMRGLASFVDAETAPLHPAPLAAAALSAPRHDRPPPPLPAAHPKATPPPIPIEGPAIRWQPSSGNPRWDDRGDSAHAAPKAARKPRA